MSLDQSRVAAREERPKQPPAPKIYPLNAPGLAPPGEELLNNARLYRVPLEQLFEEWLFSARPEHDIVCESAKPAEHQLRVVPGHPLIFQRKRVGDSYSWNKIPTNTKPPLWYGPRQHQPIMLIGKMLGRAEAQVGANFIGPSGALLCKIVSEVQLAPKDIYVTNVVKTSNPDGTTQILRWYWIRQWLPILQQEIRLLRPKVIVCLGADAAKAVLDKKATVSKMEGRIEKLEIPIGRSADDPSTHTSYVLVLPHPAAVLRAPEDEIKLRDGLALAKRCLEEKIDVREQVDHRLITSQEEFEALVREIEATCEDDLLAVDAEWHGSHPGTNAYLRTVQISWKHGTAACIRLRSQEGEFCFQGSYEALAQGLIRLCSGRRLAGHYFNADLEFLVAYGIDLRRAFSVPDDYESYRRHWMDLHLGGFDTALAAHALEETADFSLKSLAVRHARVHRYDVALENWKHDYCAEHGIKERELEGYGPCPDEILLGSLRPDGRLENSYACYDADVTRRLALLLSARLGNDGFGNDCWKPFWATMRANQAIFEINTTGVLVDPERIDVLTAAFSHAKTLLESRIRKRACWPDLNLESLPQVRELLYGEKLNGAKATAEDGSPRMLRPPTAITLGLTPMLTTDKSPMDWKEYVKGREDRSIQEEKMPAVNKLALAMLTNDLKGKIERLSREASLYPSNGAKKRFVRRRARKPAATAEPAVDVREELRRTQEAYDIVCDLRDYRVVSQMLKTVLRPEDADGKDHTARRQGFVSYLCEDDRVRTTIYPTLETGRWSSSRPNLQNISKRRETDYQRIFSSLEGTSYIAPVRSIIVAPPGHLLVEADYKSAELVAMAILSGDEVLREHTRRAMLPEDNPEYYDIHSNVAVQAFGLDCKPTKSGLASIGKKHLRDVTKAVVYGLAYGRGARAIARGVQEEGIVISEDEARTISDTFFNTYKGLKKFFDECKERVVSPRFIVNAFGRCRRFPSVTDKQRRAEQERQAMNFPIQSLVADVVNRGISALQAFRDRYGLAFRIILQIHDAVLLEVPESEVKLVVSSALPECLVRSVPIWKTDLDGRRDDSDKGPHYLDIDVSVMRRWGEPLSE